ncbi:hypothetical protein EOM39_02415 [Candidatus Gracilibacteria bacterium]|nr:hypothetical protein [Candidatus Gracilibacteria bacterium]
MAGVETKGENLENNNEKFLGEMLESGNNEKELRQLIENSRQGQDLYIFDFKQQAIYYFKKGVITKEPIDSEEKKKNEQKKLKEIQKIAYMHCLVTTKKILFKQIIMSIEKTSFFTKETRDVGQYNYYQQKENLDFIKYDEIRDTLEGNITLVNIEDYLMTFENLVKNYVQNENSSINRGEIQRVFLTGKEKIITLVKILDGLIQVSRITKKDIDEKALYEKGDITSLIGPIGDDINTLDGNILGIIEKKLEDIIESPSDQETIDENNIGSQNDDNNITDINNSDFIMPRNRIQNWLEDLTGENLAIF